MRVVFADAAYLVALLRVRDDLHAVAVAMSRELAQSPVRYVTTHLVLAEVLALVARGDAQLREDAVALVRELSADATCTVEVTTVPLFERALALYAARPDKSYSLADCASMVVCRDRGISEVLTADRDFVQEGFRALLLQDG